jgi:uncharacterized protein YjiS (DUF1127 family)
MRPSTFAEPEAHWSTVQPRAEVAGIGRSRGRSTLANLWNTLKDAYATFAERERAYRELSLLDDRMLADLGLARGEIYSAVTNSDHSHR